MNERLYQLQVQYANAIFLAARYTREAEIARALLDEMAAHLAEDQFAPVSLAPAPQDEPGKASALSADVSSLREASKRLPNFSEIAREQGVSAQHVACVFYGKRVSARISAAIERKVSLHPLQASGQERLA